jgi:ubiquinone/menaquinone biosynthesis C-methylase UbiE
VSGVVDEPGSIAPDREGSIASERERSVAFDRAAEYYDETRGLTPEGVQRNADLLAALLRGTGAVLEVGVGTGQVALPLAQRGIPMVGLDLSLPMLSQLVRKAGEHAPFPLVLGDATSLPFKDDSFGGAVIRWVLHLIPAWETAVAELVRVLHPGAVALIQMGSDHGPHAEIQERFAEITGTRLDPVGLTWEGVDQLDAAMARLGAPFRDEVTFTDHDVLSLPAFLDAIEGNRFSWTWRTPERVFHEAAAEVRAWAQDRFGPLAEVPSEERPLNWRVYEVA